MQQGHGSHTSSLTYLAGYSRKLQHVRRLVKRRGARADIHNHAHCALRAERERNSKKGKQLLYIHSKGPVARRRLCAVFPVVIDAWRTLPSRYVWNRRVSLLSRNGGMRCTLRLMEDGSCEQVGGGVRDLSLLVSFSLWLCLSMSL